MTRYLLVLGSPEADAMSIRGSITCHSNSRELDPGGITDFLLNVSVNTSGLGENYQGVRVTLTVDDGSLDSDLSVDVIRFDPGGGVRMVVLNVSVPLNTVYGQVRLMVTGEARPVTGPVTGIRSFELEPVECLVNVNRTRGLALSRKPVNLDLYQGEKDSVNVTIENLGNSWEDVHVDLRNEDKLSGVVVFLSRDTLTLSPFHRDHISLTVDAGMDASLGERELIVAVTIGDDPEGSYNVKTKVKVRVIIKPEPTGKPFEAGGDPFELERSNRDIDVLIRHSYISLGADRMEIKVSGRAAGLSLTRVKLYLVFPGDDGEKDWEWEPIGISKNSRQWNKWESDVVIMDMESDLPAYLSNLGASENVYLIAIGLDHEYTYNYDIVTKNAGDIGNLDPVKVPTETEDEDFTVFGMETSKLILMSSIVLIIGLLLIILVARAIS